MREGIELGGTATLTIPIEMRVSAVEETITVTGESPVVDVQTTRRETVLTADVVAALPGNRSVGTLLNAVPGLTVNDGALAASPTMTFFAARGGPINEGRMTVNGMTVAAPFNGGGVSTYILDSVNVDEIAVAVAGGLGETDVGGPVMNPVPRSGGNSFSGQAFINNAGSWSRGNNLNAELEAVGIRETPGIINSYDASVSYGGPIRRDRLWFFGSCRSLETASAVQGVVANRNAFDASRWDWTADPSVTARQLQGRATYVGRLTAQVSDRHRVSFNQEYQRRCEGSPLKLDTDGCHRREPGWIAAGTATTSPEANPNCFGNTPYHVTQAIWTAPMTSRLLLEAGFTRFMFRGGTTGRVPPDGIFDLISVTEQSTAINPATGLPYAPRANFTYRAVPTANPNYANPNNWRASASDVTGSHELKAAPTAAPWPAPGASRAPARPRSCAPFAPGARASPWPGTSAGARRRPMARTAGSDAAGAPGGTDRRRSMPPSSGDAGGEWGPELFGSGSPCSSARIVRHTSSPWVPSRHNGEVRCESGAVPPL